MIHVGLGFLQIFQPKDGDPIRCINYEHLVVPNMSLPLGVVG